MQSGRHICGIIKERPQKCERFEKLSTSAPSLTPVASSARGHEKKQHTDTSLRGWYSISYEKSGTLVQTLNEQGGFKTGGGKLEKDGETNQWAYF